MSWWREFASRIEFDAPLGRQTWFRLGGSARYTFHPQGEDDLASFVARARSEEVPVVVLGSGANVLVRDEGFDGAVIRLDGEAFRKVERRGTRFDVGAGVDLMPLSRRLSEEGYSGLECMAGIPATVGGATRMNAGGAHGEFGGVVGRARVFDLRGEIETWDREAIGFGYRCTKLGDRIVLSVELELREEDPQRVKRTYDEHFDHKTRTQPLADKSAGCIFKNPDGESAGALIDRAGLKGARHGKAQVSRRHGNFIVGLPGATASDVLGLIDVVRDRVRQVFSIELELEIEVWGAGASRVGRAVETSHPVAR